MAKRNYAQLNDTLQVQAILSIDEFDHTAPKPLGNGQPSLRPYVELGNAGYDPHLHDIGGPAYAVYADRVEGVFTITDNLTKAKANQIGVLSDAAMQEILSLYPEWQQRNMTARGVELLEKKLDATLTAAEQTELDNLRSAWEAIKAIRAYSDGLAAQVQAAASVAEVLAVAWAYGE